MLLQCGARRIQQLTRNLMSATVRTCASRWSSGSPRNSFKVSKRLNIDYGVRWTWAGQMYPHNPGQQSVFMRSLYDATQAPPLFTPVTQGGVKYAQNPLTGALLPAAYVGLFVPGVGIQPRAERRRAIRMCPPLCESARRTLGTAYWFRLRCV